MSSPQEYRIGTAYRLKLNGFYYRATLMEINRSVESPQAHVIIQEHSVGSFLGESTSRKRHTKHSEVVPCTDIPLTDLVS